MRRRLIPLLVLALAGGLFWWTQWEGQSPRHDVESDVSLCKQRLRAIFAGLTAYEVQQGHGPRATGGAFLGALFQGGIWEDTSEQRALLHCPGPGAVARKIPLEGPGKPEKAWSTSYTVSDFAALELGSFPAGGAYLRAIVACGGGSKMSHIGVLNVLFNDGSVKTLQLDRLISMGVLPAGSPCIPLGPESPLKELRLLLTD